MKSIHDYGYVLVSDNCHSIILGLWHVGLIAVDIEVMEQGIGLLRSTAIELYSGSFLSDFDLGGEVLGHISFPAPLELSWNAVDDAVMGELLVFACGTKLFHFPKEHGGNHVGGRGAIAF